MGISSNSRQGNSAELISERTRSVFEALMKDPNVKIGLNFLEKDNDDTTLEQIAITEISAPTFQERERGLDFQKRLIEYGLEEVEVDKQGNVFGIRRGSGNGPKVVVCAHLDTVFPEETSVKAEIKEGKVFAPGISDDGRGLSSVLTLLRAIEIADIHTTGDILFGATVGEEGLGDLNGVKALFENNKDIAGFISIEPGSPERITYLGTGSKRYHVTYTGHGGHSFGDFGKPSAIHALGRAIAAISNIKTSADPKTTFNVGTIGGGTSVNTISAHAEMLIDMRSVSTDSLIQLEEKVKDILKKSANDENKRWETNEIQVHIKQVGDRPAGSQPKDSVIVQAALASSEVLGFEPALEEPSSTDANVPISLGIPAVTLGGGGEFGGCHTLGEYYDPKDAFYGVQRIFLTLLSLVGIENVCQPLLKNI
ncbi:M20/M25/M40 family metallo-hydrolase [Heyndrickxia acidicola]|uniref:M20/M25/M40 family metallo-hydrolase n=1 Tax=Heyndrickxia acidicola TaxID=209389 RepID=A0ABU6MEH5_9BACI|nr:M20/M25/M40 family metallo-hydrolase [Heyndrickxia acidicola]MED1203063.1 M20/M25/M40 family metallo-hydrolase [Heyndrickxia acidicola]